MKKTRITALAAAAAILASFTACANNGGGEDVTTTTTAETTTATMKEEHAEIVENVEVDAEKLENGTLKWLSFWDINPTSEGKAKPVSLQLFESKYGGKIEYIPTTNDEKYTKLASLVSSGDAPDMFPAADLDTFPSKAVSGMFIPFDDYVDFDSELFPEGARKVNEMHSVNGKHYMACVSAQTGVIMAYNKKTIEENGLDDPAELAYNNEWTWSKFKEMCYDYADPDEGKYAVGGWWYEHAMLLTTGVPAIEMKDGVLTNNLMDPSLARVQELFLEMKNANVMYPYEEYEWKDHPEKVGEGDILFFPIGHWALLEPSGSSYNISSFGEEGDVMFVPMPRDENADAWYLTANGGLDAYALCKGAPNPEAVAAYINCKLIELTDESVKEVNEAELRDIYHLTDEMIEMDNYIAELTNANPVIDFHSALDPQVSGALAEALKASSYHGQDWYTAREELNGAVQTYVDELNGKMQEMGNE